MCSTRTASSVSSSSISTETLISLVEIACTLMPRSASALNISAATPVWLFMPMPTTEILATLASVMTRLKPILSLRSSSSAWVRASSALGTVKVTSVSPLSRPTFWMIMSTLIPASPSGVKISATAPGRSGTRVSTTRASFLSCAIPVTVWRSMFSFSMISSISASETIIVPGSVSAAGAPSPTNELSTCRRTLRFIARLTERVCSTFAPTEASSSISSNVTYLSLRARATMRGSVV